MTFDSSSCYFSNFPVVKLISNFLSGFGGAAIWLTENEAAADEPVIGRVKAEFLEFIEIGLFF